MYNNDNALFFCNFYAENRLPVGICNKIEVYEMIMFDDTFMSV